MVVGVDYNNNFRLNGCHGNRLPWQRLVTSVRPWISIWLPDHYLCLTHPRQHSPPVSSRLVLIICMFYPASRSERAAEYCDKLACLFVCPLARLRNHKSKLQNISTDVTCGLRLIEARTSSDGIAICCVLWVVWTTSCLLIIGQTKAMHVQGLQCSKWLTNGQHRNGAESAVYDCLFSPEPKIVSFDMHNRHFGIESVT